MTMAYRPRSELGLHHAASLGNIDAAPSQTAFNYAARNYDSEDESMSRLKSRQQQSLYSIKPPVYSKEDIIDQYCLTDRQLNNSIEAPRRDRFFGCWSTRSQQSFLGVCVGRRAPSDENLQDYAPINRHPRYQKPISYDDDVENSYFRRKPTSFLSDSKRHTWMTTTSDDDSVRTEGPRPTRNYIESNGGPYVVGGAYPQKSSFLSQSSEQITGYRCPAHINLPSNNTPASGNQNQQEMPPRTKHVSFARSLTLASFDDAIGMRQNRMLNARSQERLIGGKKSTLTITHQPHQLHQIMQVQTIPILQKPQLQQTFSQPHIGGGQILPMLPTIQQHQEQMQQKRNVMKTQATQTEVFVGRKVPATQTLSLSPRTVHRVKMVSQGAQTNGMNGNKKLTKSFSEMGTPGVVDVSCQYEDDRSDHEMLHRTQSEDSPKSPKDMSYVRPLSGYMMTTAEIHSRTSSRQSQLEENFYSKPVMHDSHSQDNFMISSRRGSHTLANEPIFIGRNELEQIRLQHGGAAILPHDFETHSLPRRVCIHHKQEEYHSHSLPRREHHHHYLEHSANSSNNNIVVEQILEKRRLSSAYQDAQPSYVNANVSADTYSLSRRSSSSQQVPSLNVINMVVAQQQQQTKHHQALQQVPPSDEMCSTCSSETESGSETEDCEEEDDYDDEQAEMNDENGEEPDEDCCDSQEYEDDEEKEIFIDFKPHISPSKDVKRKRLLKAMSEGEILLDSNEKGKQKPLSASEEDLQLQENYVEHLEYANTPIRDEDIFKNLDTSGDQAPTTTSSSSTLNRYSRDNFRKRSVSLEDPLADLEEIVKKPNKNLKPDGSTPGSPGDGKSFASSDDVTRDHSETWNDSQITILPLPPPPVLPLEGNSLLTPSTKRKHLQHQQRSSLDVEALDIEDIADQPLPPLPPLATPTFSLIPPIMEVHQSTTVSTTTQTTCLSTIKASTTVASTTTPTGIVKPTPSIAVIHTQSFENLEKKINLSQQHVKPPSHGGKRKDIKKHLQHKHKHSTALDRVHRSNESLESSGAKTSTESILKRAEGIDASEGSTTEDYITCTDNSKRMSMPPQAAHVPGIRFAPSSKGTPSSHLSGTAPSSQTTITVDGSSFESASSFHSLARVEAICEDAPTIIPPPTIDEKVKKSPTHSDSSTSSGSYRMPPIKASSPSRPPVIAKPMPIHVHVKKSKKASVSDDERSEKFQSSSHDEKDYKTLARARKPRDWNEEDRRRKKGNFKLEFEAKDSSKSPLTSPFVRPTGAIKKISPDDKTALNVLDGTSPSKTKPRFRGKTRKTPRTRTPISNDETARRLSKSSIAKSPEKPSVIAAPMPQQPKQPPAVAKIVPATDKCEMKKFLHKPCMFASPSKQGKKTSAQRLKAISTESLRSVSPGSDSVFYSEADMHEHQIHCHHCGKEVEVITAVGGSEESVVIVDDGPDIVQPPEGFADSPNGVSKIPPALKYYKRFRSEDRRHKKGANGRAKSEERGTEDLTNGKMRGTGSSPCVVPTCAHDHHGHDPEQGIYQGSYSKGQWICIADKEFWRKNEILPDAASSERRGSTDSEKEFRKKYQAITHRLVHRKSCMEMYRRQSSNSFDTDKRVIVQRVSGEFGFRIHGSKPVVVSAIEKDTPAETSGLEVGDIVLSVNSISVVDKSHSEVVKIAHAGSDTLELEVARTINALSPLNEMPATMGMQSALYSGYLWRRSGSNETSKWIRRWFCLRSDQCLYNYKTEADIQPLAITLLANHVVAHLPFEKSSRPFSFSIESPESKTLILAADTQDAANGWIAIMSHAVGQNDPWLEVSTRNLKLPPSSIIRPDCSGFLMKLGLRWRSWTKRYCVLKDACLYFYYESNSKNAIGMVCLQGYRVQPFATGGKKYAFELIPTDSKYRNYYFHTETEMEKKRWVAALEYSIDRWMKA